MKHEEKCHNCSKANTCEDAYHRMGESKAPSVAFKVIFAFVMPILIFISSLVIFESVLGKFINSEKVLIIANFLLALMVTSVIMLSIKIINKVVKHK